MKHTILVPLALLRAACIAAQDDNDWDTSNINRWQLLKVIL